MTEGKTRGNRIIYEAGNGLEEENMRKGMIEMRKT